MTLDELAQQTATTKAGIVPKQTTITHNPIAAAQAIIKDNKFRHEVAKGCRLQILQELEQGANPFKLLLYAAEAIGRLDSGADTFFLQVQQKILDVYGEEVTEQEYKRV